MKATIYFEDHGQNWLQWNIADGYITDCRPLEAWFWGGAQVLDNDLAPGDVPCVRIKSGMIAKAVYPISKIITHES